MGGRVVGRADVTFTQFLLPVDALLERQVVATLDREFEVEVRVIRLEPVVEETVVAQEGVTVTDG